MKYKWIVNWMNAAGDCDYKMFDNLEEANSHFDKLSVMAGWNVYLTEIIKRN